MSRRPPIPPLFPSPPLFRSSPARSCPPEGSRCGPRSTSRAARSEEHTSELQSRQYLVCRLLLEKKKNGSPCAHPQVDRPLLSAPSSTAATRPRGLIGASGQQHVPSVPGLPVLSFFFF